ncbi:MAG TPA: copper chaperone PCu(A)C [Allosphingosinicella sp.]|nr:copper chaperone PCu(A)C [Allosphingosinicella sp.]
MSLLLAMMLTSITARGPINPIVVAAPAGANAALYFTLRNSSHQEDRLVRVTCDCAERIELLAAGDGGLHLEGESLFMPPERLLELRPGASRHLMLLRLRRRLVAGETVEMVFHYAQGSEEETVLVVADSQAGWTTGMAAIRPRIMALAGLAGWCWRGTFPGGRRTDMRCFSPAYGMFMQDRYLIEGGAAPVSGYTSYLHDIMARSTGYRYRAPDGGQRYGRLVPMGTGVQFLDYADPPTAEPDRRTSWTPDGTDAWLVTGEVRRSSGWRESWRLRMVRAGPSPPFLWP